jgi:hypothetical protein
MTEDQALVDPRTAPQSINPRGSLPALVVEAAPAAGFAWDEFFNASIRNPHTQAADRRAVKLFLRWPEPQAVPLAKIAPGMVATNSTAGEP